MKGMELPISVIVILVAGLIVVVALVVFTSKSVKGGTNDIDSINQQNALCKTYADMRCTIANANSQESGLPSSLVDICKKTGIIAQDTQCAADLSTSEGRDKFDRECGRVCCRNLCSAQLLP